MKFTMKTKLIAFLVSALLVSGAMGFIGFFNLLALKQIVNYNENIVAKPLAYLAETSVSFGSAKSSIRDLIISETDPDGKMHDKLITSLDIIQTQLKGYADTLIRNGAAGSEEHDMVIGLTLQAKEWAEQIKTAEALMANDKKPQAIEYLQNNVEKNGEAISKTVRDLINLNKEQANISNQTSESLFAKIVVKMIFIMAVGVFVLAVMGLLIIRSITRPVSRMIIAANQLAEGDANMTVVEESSDELGQLEGALSRVSQSIATLFDDTENILTSTGTGDFLQRGDPTKHKGGYAKIIYGMNKTNSAICNHFDNIVVGIAFLSINKKIVYKNKAMVDFAQTHDLNLEDENVLANIISSNKAVQPTESADLRTKVSLLFASKKAISVEDTIVLLDAATGTHRVYTLALHRNDSKEVDIEDRYVMVTISDITALTQEKKESAIVKQV